MGNLIARAFAGLAFLLVVLGLLLFISAGTLDYWQAWVYLAVFGGCTLLVTLYLIRNDPQLLASRVKAGPVAETQGRQKIIQGAASLLFIALYVVAGLDYCYGWTRVPGWVSLLADGLVALGLGVVFLVFRENSYTSATIEVAEAQRVITTGPYAVVRHPMYAGAGLLLLATPPALGSWAALPLAVLLILVVAARAVEEEKFLARNLAGYEAYQRQVRHRLVPYIW